jgi:glutamine amidotransferase
MCRWIAYSGPPIFLDSLIFEPEHSLIDQSRHAYQSESPTNGDGFGIGWYADRATPGRFRDPLPAWNDENLRSLSGQVCSPLFFAHIRASTGSDSLRTNCHPFVHENWMFMHNGSIGEFEKVRRDLAFLVAPELFPLLRGTTDSELFFYLLFSNGLIESPDDALSRTVGLVLNVMQEAKIAAPFTMTAAVSNGDQIHALRYGFDAQAPSLYYSIGMLPGAPNKKSQKEAGNALLIVSEPLDEDLSNWMSVPESHGLLAGDGGVAVTPFKPVD